MLSQACCETSVVLTWWRLSLCENWGISGPGPGWPHTEPASGRRPPHRASRRCGVPEGRGSGYTGRKTWTLWTLSSVPFCFLSAYLWGSRGWTLSNDFKKGFMVTFSANTNNNMWKYQLLLLLTLDRQCGCHWLLSSTPLPCLLPGWPQPRWLRSGLQTSPQSGTHPSRSPPSDPPGTKV